jgi:hypothetical protein
MRAFMVAAALIERDPAPGGLARLDLLVERDRRVDVIGEDALDDVEIARDLARRQHQAQAAFHRDRPHQGEGDRGARARADLGDALDMAEAFDRGAIGIVEITGEEQPEMLCFGGVERVGDGVDRIAQAGMDREGAGEVFRDDLFDHPVDDRAVDPQPGALGLVVADRPQPALNLIGDGGHGTHDPTAWNGCRPASLLLRR